MVWRLACALVLVETASATASPELEKMWVEFKAKFSKSYDGDESERFQVFANKVAHIEAENAKNHSYRLGINQFADLTTEEAMSMLGGGQTTRGISGATYLGRHTWQGESLPDSVDWTTKGAVTPVKDQGPCASCWAFAGNCALEGVQAINTGKLVNLAEAQTMQCADTNIPNRGCQGGYEDDVFKYAAEPHAICTEEEYPYAPRDDIPCFWVVSEASCTGLPKGAISGSKDVAVDSEQDLMSAVAQQPVAVGVDARDAFLYYHSGVLTATCGEKVNHAVTVVGYGTDPVGGDYWKIKNSWGLRYGEEGYARLKRGKGGQGECAVLSQPSLPVYSQSVSV